MNPFSVFNVATGDYITVTEIARVAIDVVGLNPDDVTLHYTVEIVDGRATCRWFASTPTVSARSDGTTECSLDLH